jgi:hypothetical protein
MASRTRGPCAGTTSPGCTSLSSIEDSKDGPRLTTAGKLRFDILLKASSLDMTSRPDEMLRVLVCRAANPALTPVIWRLQ